MAKDFKITRRYGGIYETFEVKGLSDLEKDLFRMGQELATQKGIVAAKAAMMPVAANVRSNIRSQRLKDTGSLLQSVRQSCKVSKKNKRVINSMVMAGHDRRGAYKSRKNKGKHRAAYALQNEFGTKTGTWFSGFKPTKERPFMRPAFDGKERQIANRLKQLLNNGIIAWKYKGGKGT